MKQMDLNVYPVGGRTTQEGIIPNDVKTVISLYSPHGICLTKRCMRNKISNSSQ